MPSLVYWFMLCKLGRGFVISATRMENRKEMKKEKKGTKLCQMGRGREVS